MSPLLVTPAAGHPQQGAGPATAGLPLEHWVTVLNLTGDQKTKVQPILDQTRPQLQAIRQEAMTKSKAVFQSARDQLKTILTPEQQQKLDQMQLQPKPSTATPQATQSAPAATPAKPPGT